MYIFETPVSTTFIKNPSGLRKNKTFGYFPKERYTNLHRKRKIKDDSEISYFIRRKSSRILRSLFKRVKDNKFVK